MSVSITQCVKYLIADVIVLAAACGYAMGTAIDVSSNENRKLPDDAPEITLDDKYLICDDQPLMLDAGNEGLGAIYKWENLLTNKVASTERRFEVSRTGNYRLTVTIGTESASKDFVVTESFTPQISIETKTYTLCAGSVITLDAGNPGANFLWMNDNSGDTISESQTATIAFKGKYTVAAITPCGTSVSSFIVDEIEYPDLKEVPAIGYLCAGDSVTIDAKNFGSHAAWIDMESGDTIATTKRTTFGKLGDYKLILYNQCDTVSKVVTIASREAPTIELDDEMFICENESIQLDAGNAGADYEWVNVETKAIIGYSQKITVDKGGLFSVKVIDPCGVVFDTVKVSKTDSPKIALKDQYLICDGVADEIKLNLFDVTVEWTRNGDVISTGSVFVPAEAGDYLVSVSNGCGTVNHDFSVVESFVPEITIPAEVNVIALDGSVILDAENEGASYKWIDVALGSILAETQTIEITRSGEYILSVATACGGVEKAIAVNLITSVHEKDKEASYTISPNPASSSVSIQKNGTRQEHLSITLHDITGKRVFDIPKLPGLKEKDIYTLDVSAFSRGVYILSISGERTYRTKMILQ